MSLSHGKSPEKTRKSAGAAGESRGRAVARQTKGNGFPPRGTATSGSRRETGAGGSAPGMPADACRLILDALQDGVLVASSATEKFVYANASVSRMLGYSQAELLALTPTDLHPPEFRDFTIRNFEELQAGGIDAVNGIPTVRKDGAVFISDISVSSLTINGRHLLIGTFRDTTRMRQGKAILKAREARLSRAESMAGMGHFAFDSDGSNLICSDGLKKIYGFDPDSNPQFAEFRARIHPEDAQWIAPEFAKRMRERRGYGAEYRIVRPDGTEVRVVTTAEVEIVEPAAQPRWFGTVLDITARKRIEAALRESEELFRRVIEATNDGVWDWNLLTHEDYHSPRWEQIAGYAAGELPHVDSAFFHLVHPDDKPLVEEALRSHWEQKEPYNAEYRVRHKDGTWRWVLSRGKAVFDSSGRPVRMTGAVTDITERKLTESRLRESEERYRRLHESIADAFVEVDMTGRIVDFNYSFRQMLGYSAEELRKMNRLDLTPECWHDLDARIYAEQILPLGTSEVYEKEYRRKDGSTVPVEVHSFLLKDGSGAPIGMWAIVRDISERRRAKAALAAERDRLRQILDSQFGFVAVMTPDGNIVEVNQTPLTLMRLKRAEVLGRPFWEIGWLQPGTEHISREGIRRAAQGEVVRTDIAGQLPGGRQRHIDSVFSPIRGAAGNVTDVMGFGVDITDRKRAEELAREREAALNIAQEIAQIGSWDLDLVSGRLNWSDEVFRIFEIDKQAFRASYEAFLDLVHPEDRTTVDEGYNDSLKTRQPYEIVHRLRMRDGRIKFVSERGRTEFADDGRPLRSLGTVQDITEKKRAEDLILAQLMEKEVLLREIHHRVKNNLQIISSLLHLQSAGNQNAAVTKLVEDCRRRIYAMASIHEILYKSNDLGSVEIVPYLGKLVSALYVTHTHAGRDIQVLTDVAVSHLDIQRAIPCGLIVSELVTNSFKHAFQGREKGTLRVTFRETAPGWLRLAVQDDGNGLPVAANQAVRGSGLQLVQLLAEQIGGSLETSSGPGAELSVKFPAAP